jgi:hypothetical protein
LKIRVGQLRVRVRGMMPRDYVHYKRMLVTKILLCF